MQGGIIGTSALDLKLTNYSLLRMINEEVQTNECMHLTFSACMPSILYAATNNTRIGERWEIPKKNRRIMKKY